MKPRFLPIFAMLPLGVGTQALAQSTFNTASDGGTWGTPANWTPAGVPNAAGAEAIVNGAGPSGVAPATTALDVLLDGNYTIGKLTRSVTASVAATFPTSPASMDATKGLTLQTGSGLPQINTLGDVFFYSAIFGTQGFEKTGAGRFTFRFNSIDHTYTGPVKVSAGTLGIEKNSSLGDPANDIEIVGGARLFAEPGANSGTITLPSSRSITLSGGGGGAQQIGANPAQVNLVIEGDITEADPSGITKTDAGILTLSGSNSWAGTTTVNGGVLSLVQPAALPGFNSMDDTFGQSYVVNAGATLAVRFGDASIWNFTQLSNLVSTANFNGTGSFGIDTAGNLTDTVITDDLVGAGAAQFTKLGAGKLTLSNSPGLSRVTMYDGTLALGASSSVSAGCVFVFSKTGTVLDLGTTAASISDFIEFNGGSSTVTNGALTYTGASLTLSGNNGTTVDWSGLTAFTYATSGTELKLENSNNVNASQNTTLFSAGTNTITASGRILVGGGPSNANGVHLNTARFGTTNTINTNLFQLGGFNNAGLVNFQTGLTAPSMKIRAANGTSAIPSMVVGETSSGVRSGAGTLDLTGGSADILATGIVLGRHIAGSNNGATSAITVADGTVQAVNLIISEKTGGGTPANNATFNQQGTAAVNVDSIVLGQTGTGAAATGQVLQGNYVLDGGTLTTSAVNGFAQVETAAANGNVTTSGSLDVTLTSADLGAPVIINVAVNSGDIPTGNGGNDWTVKVANALNADPAVFAKFAATRANNAVILTRRTAGTADATLNLAIANGTAAGITEVATSTDTVTSRNTSTGIARNLILRGGTLVNKAGADLAISGVTMLAAGNTTTVVDSTTGQKVVLAADATYAARIHSFNGTSGALNVDGDLDLTASPAFSIFDDAPTDATPLPGGTKLVLIDYQDGSLTGTFAGLADGATVSVTKGTVTNDFVLDYDDPAFGGKAVTLTIAGAANDYASWASSQVPPVTGGPNGDSDSDGVRNLIEYALVDGGERGVVSGNTITFTKRGAPYGTDITYAIETSEDLGISDPWSAATPDVNDATTISYTLQNPGDNFARLKITQN